MIKYLVDHGINIFTQVQGPQILIFAGLKRLTAIFFLFVFLFSATELRQLVKLPVLVQHYQEHRAENGDLGFMHFLYMHYAGDDHNDQDEDRDMQLPFKSCEGPATFCFTTIPPSISLTMEKPLVRERNVVLFKDQDARSSYMASIWQPPQ